MLSYLTIGANDLARSGQFYAAILAPLGYHWSDSPEGIAFTPPDAPAGHAAIYVKHPFDGAPATPGNGAMLAFAAPTHALVRALHAAGLATGGADEGPPGFRAAYSAHFYVAYLRDPAGNKLALFCADPAEGARPA